MRLVRGDWGKQDWRWIYDLRVQDVKRGAIEPVFLQSLDEHIKGGFEKNNTDTSKEQYTDACTSI